MAVTLVSSPGEASDAAPGLTVLMGGEEPGVVALQVAELLGAPPPCTPDEAEVVLSAAGAGPEDEPAREPDALAAARTALTEALERVPPSARRARPARVRAASGSVRTAEEAVADARSLLGERPDLPAEAAQAAAAAEEALRRAEERRAAGVDHAGALLLAANAIGILIVAGRIRTALVDPIFVLVTILPLAALAYLASAVLTGTRQARAARRCRAEALRAAGMATMTGLVARQARLKAWSARAEALATAEARLQHARQRWVSLVGERVEPSEAAELATALEDVEAAAAALQELESGGEGPSPDAEVPASVHTTAGPDDGHTVEDEESLDESVATALVVLAELDGSAGASARGLPELLEGLGRLERLAGPATVVVVTGLGQVEAWAAGRVSEDEPANVVDIRERATASLERLRRRATAFRDTTATDTIAADG